MGEETIVTPFTNMEMKVGERYKDTKPMAVQFVSGLGVIEGGMFHSCKYASDAEYCVKGFSTNSTKRYVVAECIIPIGAEYFNGEDGDIASRELIVNRVLSKAELKKLSKKECVYSVFVNNKEVVRNLNYSQATDRAKWEFAAEKDAFVKKSNSLAR